MTKNIEGLIFLNRVLNIGRERGRVQRVRVQRGRVQRGREQILEQEN